MRPFAWHDLYTVYRYRNQVLSLDSAHLLSQGNPIGLSGLLSTLNPGLGTFIGVSSKKKNSQPLIGQMRCTQGNRSAHLSFLLPENRCTLANVQSIIDGMVVQAGKWGAYQLLAEIEENNPAFTILRKSGFSVYARQNVWQLEPITEDKNNNLKWSSISSQEEVAVRNLYHALVPPLVQRAEPFRELRQNGMIYVQGGEVLAYIDGTFGPHGIYLHPLFHPEVENVVDLLNSLPKCFSPLLGRPIYLAIRSYQGWLESALHTIKARPMPRQAVMARYLTNVLRVPSLAERLSPVFDSAKTEPSATLMQNIVTAKNNDK